MIYLPQFVFCFFHIHYIAKIIQIPLSTYSFYIPNLELGHFVPICSYLKSIQHLWDELERRL